jgi:aspartyl aminopeptidase
VGSRTTAGAAGPFLETLLERICGGREEYFRAVTKSVMVSADCAHAVHPDWANKHSQQSRPRLNGGPAVKYSVMQNYATCVETGAYFTRCAARAGVTLQEFTGRTDALAGSTIGPITASRTGIPTVDVGNPMLAMHSIRETSGAHDHRKMMDCMRVHMSSEVPFKV